MGSTALEHGQSELRTASRQRRILVLSSVFPSSVQPTHGVFVKERVRAIADLPGYQVRVVSPVPYFPPIRRFKKWYPFSQMAHEESIDGLQVVRPRYFLPPKVGGYFHTELMYSAAKRAIDQIRRDFDFDLIDAHFVYPNGVVATKLGQLYRKPVVITGRGEDILRFPQLPLIGRRIRYAMRNATRFVALSGEIAQAMRTQGADPSRICLIPNGVDCEKFQPLKRDESRRRLDLPMDRLIVVSVGDLQERKGFHLLLDALPRIRERYPEVFVVIVGGAAPYGHDYTPEITDRIRAHQLEDHVRLAGRRPHDELAHWYSAADLFTLLSSREGSPNVLMEALACGVPAVATPVGGVPEVLADRRLGVLLPERSVEATIDGITAALSRTWDRDYIRRKMEDRSWQATAQDVSHVFDRALAVHSRSESS